MGSGESDVAEGGGEASEVAPACSICLEVVLIGGQRSTVKLQCGHEFHLDCIGSAFNAKGMMQCPNCRNVEKGNWLYVNGYCFCPSLNMDELTRDDELYELNFLEMPYGVRWCPVSRTGRVTSSFENAESFPSFAFQDLVGHHVITELPSISVFAHPCPHLSGFHQVQPTPTPTFHTSSDGITDTSLYYHQWSQVSESTEVPSPLTLPNSDAHYHVWDRYQSTYSHPRDISTASIQAPVSHATPRSTRPEDGGPPRAGSLFYSFIGGRPGSHASPVPPHVSSSNRAPANTQEHHRHANMSADPWRSGNSTDPSFVGRSLWLPSNRFGVYMYPVPFMFNSTIGELNTGVQFQRSGVQFMPFTSHTGSTESGSWTGYRHRNSSSESQIAQARTENPSYGSNRGRPYI